MLSFKSFRSSFVGIVLVGLCTLAPKRAAASDVFPAALQEAAGMPCTPSCVVCHGKVPGDLGSFQARKLPRDVLVPPNGALPPAGAAGVPVVKSDFAKYAAKAATDPEVARVVAALKNGMDPETGDSLCGPTYGCSLRVTEKAPRNDIASPLWVVGALAIGALLRRRKREG